MTVHIPKIPKFLKISFTLLLLITISFILTTLGSRQKSPENYFLGSKNLTPLFKKENQAVKNLVQEATQNASGRYAIFVKDLKNNQIYQASADQKFPSASLYKLAVMHKTYDELAHGNLKKADVLSEEQFVLDQVLQGKQNISQSPNPENQTTVTYSVENALRAMITISDNYSAILLAEKLGWENIDNFLKQKGLTDFDLAGQDAPQVTAAAAGNLLEQIYAGRAVNKQASIEMKDLLLAQTVNDRIPKYLPKEVKVGHKTGELDFLRHDAGIVFGKKSHYIFVFLSETPIPEEASENISSLSRQIYNLLEKD